MDTTISPNFFSLPFKYDETYKKLCCSISFCLFQKQENVLSYIEYKTLRINLYVTVIHHSVFCQFGNNKLTPLHYIRSKATVIQSIFSNVVYITLSPLYKSQALFHLHINIIIMEVLYFREAKSLVLHHMITHYEYKNLVIVGDDSPIGSLHMCF